MAAVVVLKGLEYEFVFSLLLESVREEFWESCVKGFEEQKRRREEDITTTRGNRK